MGHVSLASTAYCLPLLDPLLEQAAQRVAQRIGPVLAAKRVHPHVLRHTAASHFLQAGVDLVTIGRWLGHASVSSTSIYAEVDLESKRQAVRKAKPLLNTDPGCGGRRTDADLLSWLESL